MFLSTVCWVAAFIVDRLVLAVVLIVIALCSTLLAALAMWAPERVGVPAVPSGGRRAHPAGKRGAAPRRAGPSGTRPRRCSVRCRKSVRLVESCDCSCGGRLHGSEVAGGPKHREPDHRAWLTGPEAREIEERVVRAHQRRQR